MADFLPLPDKEYQVIYADPPWEYRQHGTTAPFEGHSKKPDETRRRIVELLGDVPRLELFARDRAPGWDAWGNEVPPAE